MEMMNNLLKTNSEQTTLIPHLDDFSIAFWIADFPIMWYSIFFMLGFFISICIGCAICHYRYKIKYDAIFWFSLVLIPSGIFGARFWSAMIGDLEWSQFFNFWGNGGFAIQGGVIFSSLAALIFFPWILNKPSYHVQEVENGKTYIRKPSLWIIADIALPLILFGQAIGRWGNFFNGEIFGAQTTYDSIKWLGAIAEKMQVVQGVTDKGELVPLTAGLIAGEFYQPLFFYEFLSNMICWGIIYWILPLFKKIKIGVIGSSYFVIYGITRFVMEPLRFASYAFTATYWLNGILLILGICLMIIAQFIAPKYRDKQAWRYIWICYIRYYFIKVCLKLKIKYVDKYLLLDPELSKYGCDKKPDFSRNESNYFYYGYR
ncbi:MAG: prolipoprotein diacylglyceryl transferase [Mycoplasma sp.]